MCVSPAEARMMTPGLRCVSYDFTETQKPLCTNPLNMVGIHNKVSYKQVMNPSKKFNDIKDKVKDPEWLTGMLVAAVTMNPGEAAKELAKLLKSDDDTPDQLKAIYIESFASALTKDRKDVFKKEAAKLAFNPLVLDVDHPALHPRFWDYYLCLRSLLPEEQLAEKGSIQDFQGFRKWFTDAFHKNLVNTLGESRVADLRSIQALRKPSSEAEHEDHLRQIIAENISNPLPIDPDIRLADIYIIPGLTVTHCKDNPGQWSEKDKRLLKQDLILELISLTGQDGDEDPNANAEPIILHGEPGHGKSSSLRMFIHYLLARDIGQLEKPPCQVLFYEFRNLGLLDTDLFTVLRKLTPFVHGEAFFHGKETLLILDGMDERQLTGDDDRYFRHFIEELLRTAGRVNGRNDGSCLRLVFSGRSQYFHSVEHLFRRPYYELEIENFDQERVHIFLQRYRRLKKLPDGVLDQEMLESYRLTDLMHQPILLTICAKLLSDRIGLKLLNQRGKEDINRTAIYQIIARWTWERRWQHGVRHKSELQWEPFVQLLRMTGLILFRKGKTDIGTDELLDALVANRERYNLQILNDRTDRDIEDILRELTVGFFIEGSQNNKFWFIHASIRDYFSVEGLIWLIGDAIDEFNPRKPEKSLRQLADSLYHVFGYRALSAEDHKPFLREILCRTQGIAEWVDPLMALFNHAFVDHEFLSDQDIPEGANPITFEAYFLTNLLVLITEVFQADRGINGADSMISEDLFTELPPNWLSDIYGLSQQAEKQLLSKLHLDFSSMNLEALELEHLSLNNAKFYNTVFDGVTFSFADLGNCDFTNAVFEDTKIISTNLQNAKGLTPE